MFKIAIIQFPGINTEYETRREINRAGMRGEFFRWNDSSAKLRNFDGYVIGGGFAYEDRGRAGIIAALDPLMEVLREEAARGKPVLGICNGAQILVEAGLIPGATHNRLAMALAHNKRMADGRIIGTGYYNVWTHLKCTVPSERCMFTWDMKEGEILEAPVAHGEGRYVSNVPDIWLELKSKQCMVFRYCDERGVTTEQFPINPNGTAFNVAALCNPAGNVMAVMPHLERSPAASYKLFTSLRNALTARRSRTASTKRVATLNVPANQLLPLGTYAESDKKTIHLFVSLIITDNEAQTFELTLQRLGFSGIRLVRRIHYAITYKGTPSIEKLTRNIMQSGVFMNTNKEEAVVKRGKPEITAGEQVYRILVREKDDLVGMAKTATLQERLKMSEVVAVRTGTVWEIHFPTKSGTVAESQFKKIVHTHLFWNPHRQEAMFIV